MTTTAPIEPAYTYAAIVVRVVDGDTIDADIDLGFGVWMRKQRLRLLDVRAPEMTGDDRQAGIHASNMLAGWIIGAAVTIRTEVDKADKYGRKLANVFLPDGRCVNQLMRENAPVGGR